MVKRVWASERMSVPVHKRVRMYKMHIDYIDLFVLCHDPSTLSTIVENLRIADMLLETVTDFTP